MCNREAHTYITWTLLSFVSQPHGLTLILKQAQCRPPKCKNVSQNSCWEALIVAYQSQIVFTQEQKCAIWILIRIAQFEWRYFGPCIRKITLRCVIWMTEFWTVCTQNYTAMCDLNWAFQITHCDVILRTHGPKYCHSNDYLNCAIQLKIQIAHFCSRVKTVSLTDTWQCMPVQKAWAIREVKTMSSYPIPTPPPPPAASIAFERSSHWNNQHAPRIDQNSIWKHLRTTICYLNKSLETIF